MYAQELQSERDALIAEIYAAFKDVSREGGVSWSETSALDDYGTEEECAQARAKDQEWGWTDLVDDPEWQVLPGCGGFSFLDAIGFRYYLPAALVRSLRSGRDEGIRFHLTLVPSRETDHLRTGSAISAEHHDELNAGQLEKWSLLDNRQRLGVVQFLRHMIALCRGKDHRWQDELREWNRAHESYWKSLE